MGYACEDCNNYVYDEDEEAYICVQDMDEDDFYKVISSKFRVYNCKIEAFVLD